MKTKEQQATDFWNWLDSQEIPADYDRVNLGFCSLNNAADVDFSEVYTVARATAEMYLDQREMAVEAGIIC